jgi:hypothetical protein
MQMWYEEVDRWAVVLVGTDNAVGIWETVLGPWPNLPQFGREAA